MKFFFCVIASCIVWMLIGSIVVGIIARVQDLTGINAINSLSMEFDEHSDDDFTFLWAFFFPVAIMVILPPLIVNWFRHM